MFKCINDLGYNDILAVAKKSTKYIIRIKMRVKLTESKDSGYKEFVTTIPMWFAVNSQVRGSSDVKNALQTMYPNTSMFEVEVK